MNKIHIYLASKSQRRMDLLREAQIDFTPISSSYQEVSLAMPPHELVLRHALGKASCAHLPEHKYEIGSRDFILGSDTIVVFENRVLGKPRDTNQALEWLSQMSGKTNVVYTGIALIHCRTNQTKTSYAKTMVRIKSWNQQEIESYASTVSLLDKAGAYAIQSEPCIVESIEGSMSNVIGLPLELLQETIRQFST